MIDFWFMTSACCCISKAVLYAMCCVAAKVNCTVGVLSRLLIEIHVENGQKAKSARVTSDIVDQAKLKTFAHVLCAIP